MAHAEAQRAQPRASSLRERRAHVAWRHGADDAAVAAARCSDERAAARRLFHRTPDMVRVRGAQK